MCCFFENIAEIMRVRIAPSKTVAINFTMPIDTGLKKSESNFDFDSVLSAGGALSGSFADSANSANRFVIIGLA